MRASFSIIHNKSSMTLIWLIKPGKPFKPAGILFWTQMSTFILAPDSKSLVATYQPSYQLTPACLKPEALPECL